LGTRFFVHHKTVSADKNVKCFSDRV
jgi:hypothetical protein